ncbi:uncharacterized protein LOC128742737 [Sabethes cyaneus]|uniref:uncharacterized protein LOC128742737 n=1 Tax=Sabethes cyaneus TaxID=53552 RepID=UPI00237D929C|nr:uncharacterized protein LOC128742737 [Sabethes cyaneus]
MDEDVEFRDMVLKKLEENGSLLDIKAKLRAHLYSIIESDGKPSPETLQESDETYNGDKTEFDGEEDKSEEPADLTNRDISLGLVFDLLDCLKLPYTKQVLRAEARIKNPLSRDHLLEVVTTPQVDFDTSESSVESPPVLFQLIERSRKFSSSKSEVALTSTENTIEDGTAT